MSVLFVAVPAALAVAVSAAIAFLWAARSGQLDDLETPALRMLHDDASRPAATLEPAPASRHTEPSAGEARADAPRRG
jgi:cbb3-type cytochrome oxidase maturation protein